MLFAGTMNLIQLFEISENDYCLHKKNNIFLRLNVDDILISGNNATEKVILQPVFFKSYGNLISWKASKQKTISLSYTKTIRSVKHSCTRRYLVKRIIE